MSSSSTPATGSNHFMKPRRAYVACTNCRKRKIKCVTVSEVDYRPCTRCAKKGLQCEYFAVPEDYSTQRDTPPPENQAPPDNAAFGRENDYLGGNSSSSMGVRSGMVPPAAGGRATRTGPGLRQQLQRQLLQHLSPQGAAAPSTTILVHLSTSRVPTNAAAPRNSDTSVLFQRHAVYTYCKYWAWRRFFLWSELWAKLRAPGSTRWLASSDDTDAPLLASAFARPDRATAVPI
ncbi:hypothetical protein B0H13DRAFT_1877693 [Mycena leptocephala]|nr:hypothetical protein B0H13DRAFT_1877693 [Mycena leptocephala]